MSGGPDSLALLVLACAAGCDVTAVHVDHGLREGSADEAAVVADAADRFGAAFRAERIVIGPGGNVEARARGARRVVLPPDHATGHTADDRAETVLLSVLRGSGLDGLATLRPGPAHPILGLRRAETHALCADLGLVPVDDPSNTDPRFRRNRLRHEVLPLLADVAGHDVVPLLCRLAELAQGEVDTLDELTAAAVPDPTDARRVASAEPSLASRAIRRWLRDLDPDGHPPELAALGRVLAVVHGEAVATELPGGGRVARTGGRLRFEPPPARQ